MDKSAIYTYQSPKDGISCHRSSFTSTKKPLWIDTQTNRSPGAYKAIDIEAKIGIPSYGIVYIVVVKWLV